MYTNMKNIALAAGVSVIALSGSAFADEKIMVSAIDVESSVSASTEANAMDFYPDLEEPTCRSGRARADEQRCRRSADQD